MKRFGTPDQIESLRTVLNDLLGLHFPGLSVGDIVPASFARREYEVEIVNPKQRRTAWLEVTQEELERVAASDSTRLHESLTRFVWNVGFNK